MKKAITYMQNQWESLRNFVLDARTQLSINLCEQWMKPIKLNLKICPNIGSETAAEKCFFHVLSDGNLQTEQVEGRTLYGDFI